MAAAIGWLVQTISATLKIDKLDAWIRQVGLADDIQKLKSEIWRVKIVVSDAKDKGARNELLDEAFALLEERLYEADDVVDELDYYRLQQQVEGGLPAPADPREPLPLLGVTMGEPEGVLVAGQFDEISRGDVDTQQSNVGNLRSVVWDHFMITAIVEGKRSKAKCNYCPKEFNCDTTTNGTSSMIKHLEKEHSVSCKKRPGAHPPNPSSTGDPIVGSSSGGKGKKRRSKAWDDYEVIENENTRSMKAICKYCDTEIKCGGTTGTSGMRNHTEICKKKRVQDGQPPNLSSTGDAIANATHIPAQISAANTHTPCDKGTLSNRIQEIINQLQVIRGQVSEVVKLHGSDIPSSSNHHQNTTLDQHRSTTSLVPWNVYGRVAEKNSIIKMITEEKSDGVVVLPIVGIAGVGKTTLAQLVYSDPHVEHQFDQRIWLWVSRNFDEMRLTREMLSFASQQNHEGINSFAKLQEILKSHVKSKRVLLILDDVWNDKKDARWNQLLAPFNSANGNVILLTTRKLSVAKMIGTTEPVKLGALEKEDFYLLFKSCALGDEKNDYPRNLSTIGKQIVKKLQGNPLAAITTGSLLGGHLTVDHWSNILRKESWKSLGLSGGIMAALKLSYDELPYHLQQCLSYCSIFPNKHIFLAKDLVYIWISQGFVNCTQFNKRLEETGWGYLCDLVNLGFFQQVEEQEEEDEEEFSRGSQIQYSMCGLMHDYARKVSETECATIDGLQCNKMLPTIRHLSIITVSAYNKDQHGNIPRNEKFEDNLRNTVTSVSKLRTLVLLGNFDSFFVQVFQDIFQKAQNLRMLQVYAESNLFQLSAVSSGFNSFWCSLAIPLHLRYIKLEKYTVVPQDLSTFFHLQVFDVGSNMNTSLPNGLHDLFTLRHLVVHKGVNSAIAGIGNMTSIQELHDFEVRISSGFEITQLKSMNELVQLGVSQLDSVKTREEAYGAGLRNKEHLEELHLSWNDTFSENESVSDTISESSVNMAREVIEGLEPHMDLKHLHISGYNGTTSPTWLANNISVTSLQTLHLDDCRGWRILPSLGSLPFLTKLKLSSMREVIEVLVPSLEELVLIDMPKLVRCSSTSVGALNSSLRALQIMDCEALKEKLILCECPQLEVLKSLLLPTMEGSSSGNLPIEDVPAFPSLGSLTIGLCGISGKQLSLMLQHAPNLEELDLNSLEALTEDSSSGDPDDAWSARKEDFYIPLKLASTLKKITMKDCPHLTFINWSRSGGGFSGFAFLERLTIRDSPDLLSPLVHKDGSDDEANGRWLLPPSLEELDIDDYHSHGTLQPCFPRDSTSLKRLVVQWGRDLHTIQLHSCTALEKLSIKSCWSLTALEGLQFPGLVHEANGRWLLPTSLRKLKIKDIHSHETLQPWFPTDSTNLESLEVQRCRGLQSIQLDSCTAVEKLTIRDCGWLTALEGLQCLGSLRHLDVSFCPGLPPFLESLSRPETLCIDDPSVLTTSFCKHLTSLQSLILHHLVEMRSLTDEQERALVLHKSLKELQFSLCLIS
uniref:NBS-LRR disease resistance protein n=1 Tax=Dasypyrum villosum TaxID=40247 RepID=A0A8K1MIU5_9POAL|nr:NBS-LRR disease resistance protein [Dasypyrum villosum]